jgi:hypothetical protein
VPEDAASKVGAVSAPTLSLRVDDLKWTETDRGVTVLDLRSARYLQLNRSGAVLWTRLSVGATVEQLVEALCTRFGIDADRARGDVTEFLAAVRERGFLTS